VIQNFEYFDMC